jgi:hypothetical protein
MYLDIELFAQVLLSHHCTDKTPDFHREIFRLLEDDTIKQKAIIAPRGHSKSTIASLIYPLYRIVFQKERFIVIVSESYQQSVLFLDAIKRELEENEKLKFFFGDLRSDKWAEGDIVTATNIRIIAKGSGQKMRGLKFRQWRPTMIVLDDLFLKERFEVI